MMGKMRWVTACAAIGVVACASAEEKTSPPSEARYSISFPSTAAAVATESVQLLVFDGTAPDLDCPAIEAKRRTGQALPAHLADTGLVTPCDMLKESNGTASIDGESGKLKAVGYGRRLFL